MKKRPPHPHRNAPDLCTTCGNELPPAAATCPFCAAPREFTARPVAATSRLFTINLKQGLPTVDQAMTRLGHELDTARASGAPVIRIIHGWGSSGKGGAIRDEVRRQLAALHRTQRLGSVVHGEDFGERTNAGRELMTRMPSLRDDRSNIGNPGITFITLARG